MIRAAVLLVVSVAGCSSASKPPVKEPPVVKQDAKPKHGNVTPRSELPAALRDKVPQHGLYAAGGGLMSSAWRVVVDRDAKTVASGVSQKANASSVGGMEKESAPAPIGDAALAELAKLADAAWDEVPPSTPPSPTADYDEIVIVADGDTTFFHEGFGPIRRPLAAKLVAALRKTAGL